MAPAGAPRCLAALLAPVLPPLFARRSSFSTPLTSGARPSNAPSPLNESSGRCALFFGVTSPAMVSSTTRRMAAKKSTSLPTPPCGPSLHLAALATLESSSAPLDGRLASPNSGMDARATPALMSRPPVLRQPSFRAGSWPPCARRPLRHAGCPCLQIGGPPPLPSLRRTPIASGTTPAATHARCTGPASCPGRALWPATPWPSRAAWLPVPA
jgi:hypothetical protein